MLLFRKLKFSLRFKCYNFFHALESASDEEETEEVDGLALGGLPLEFLNIQR